MWAPTVQSRPGSVSPTNSDEGTWVLHPGASSARGYYPEVTRDAVPRWDTARAIRQGVTGSGDSARTIHL